MKMSAAHPQVPQSVQRETAEKGESVQYSIETILTIPHLKHLHITRSGKPLHTHLLFHTRINLLYNPLFTDFLQED